MKPRQLPAICLAIALATTGCSTGSADTNPAIPRPKAYPRPALPDTTLTPVTDAPLLFPVNTQAITGRPRPDWLDITYPTLGLRLHTSFTRLPEAEIARALDNRMERVRLNAGSFNPDITTAVNPAGFEIMIARADEAPTPLQFVATDGHKWIVSGAASYITPTTAPDPDSVGPLIDAIERDLAASLKALAPLP